MVAVVVVNGWKRVVCLPVGRKGLEVWSFWSFFGWLTNWIVLMHRHVRR